MLTKKPKFGASQTFYRALLACLTVSLCGQSQPSTATNYSFDKAVHSPKPFKKYLGDIRDEEGRTLFRVVSRFHTFQTARALHGHSRVTFFTPDWKKAAEYDVELPENLPFELKNNTLHFNTISLGKKTVSKQSVSTSLPQFLCVAPNDCYAQQR